MRRYWQFISFWLAISICNLHFEKSTIENFEFIIFPFWYSFQISISTIKWQRILTSKVQIIYRRTINKNVWWVKWKNLPRQHPSKFTEKQKLLSLSCYIFVCVMFFFVFFFYLFRPYFIYLFYFNLDITSLSIDMFYMILIHLFFYVNVINMYINNIIIMLENHNFIS